MADNTKHLIPLQNRSPEERRAIASMGGKASGKNRRERKLLREEILKQMNETDWKEMCRHLIDRAYDNDKSFELLRDTIGQKPRDQIEVNVENTIKINITGDDND